MDDKIIPVKVAVRGRPMVDKEIGEGCQTCIMFVPGEQQIIVGKDKVFAYDFVYASSVNQETIYSEAVVPLVHGLFKGYNATVLAYGQTGSGKTYTMGGAYGVKVDGIEDITGVIPRVIHDLFDGIKQREEKFEFAVKISYLEIYKEDLLDLLVPVQKRDKDQISIREDVSGGIKLIGLNEVDVNSADQVMRHLMEGSQGRTVGATAMNNTSSRSHAIFTIHIERKSRSDSQDFCKAKFHLVDLAGSERIKKTLAEGERMKEGININRGLLALGNVISALGDEGTKRGHIPYRDSKLTRLLQDSLGGNSHTLMIACVSPADSNMEETISTLRYADRARKIKNKPIVNRDPQVAEILRLRQMVMELQSGKLPSSSICSSTESDLDYKLLVERNRKLEEDNRKLAVELQSAIGQNTDITEKFVRSELTRDQLSNQLHELKHKTGLSISQMMNATRPITEEGETHASYSAEAFEQHLSIMKEVHDKIEEIEVNSNDRMNTINEADEGEDGTQLSSGGSAITEEVRNRHVLRQAQLSRELQDLNAMLARKQELAGQMLLSDEQMQAMRSQYETQMKDLETEINTLVKEKEDLNHALQSVKSTSNNNKVAEQRRKRLQELEAQIGELKRKMQEQNRMLKMKEQTDKQVEKLNQEIQLMKQQRVKLMNQIKDDAEQFRKLKSELAKEVLQLKSQDRKRLAEIARLERQHVNQQAVLRRKAEEAAAANNRLKEVLLRQKSVADDRMKKQESADLSGIGARVRKILNEELDFLVSVESARMHLTSQISARKDIMEQLNAAKKKLEIVTGSDEEASTKALVDELEQQMELCSVQIADLQQKLLDADQDEKCKSRWSNIHTMVEAKCAMKWLLNIAVASKVECGKKDSEIADVKTIYDENLKSVEAADSEQREMKKNFEHELHALRKEYESKVLYLMTQLRNATSHLSADLLDSELRKRIQFQEAEIARLSYLEEEIVNKTKECDRLRQELTKVQYNRTVGREGSLMPVDLESTIDSKTSMPAPQSGFFGPNFYTKQSKRRKTFGKSSETSSVKSFVSLPVIEDPASEDEDQKDSDGDSDPDWVSGNTPAAFEKRAVSRVTRGKIENEVNNSPLCKCKSDCSTRRCACYKDGRGCGDTCGCVQDKCQNRPAVHPESTTDIEIMSKPSGDDSSMNLTFTVDNVVEAREENRENTAVGLATRKRSSSDKKLVASKVKEVEMESIASGDNDSSPTDVFSDSGINALAKKRRLLTSRQSYFGDV